MIEQQEERSVGKESDRERKREREGGEGEEG